MTVRTHSNTQVHFRLSLDVVKGRQALNVLDPVCDLVDQNAS